MKDGGCSDELLSLRLRLRLWYSERGFGFAASLIRPSLWCRRNRLRWPLDHESGGSLRALRYTWCLFRGPDSCRCLFTFFAGAAKRRCNVSTFSCQFNSWRFYQGLTLDLRQDWFDQRSHSSRMDEKFRGQEAESRYLGCYSKLSLSWSPSFRREEFLRAGALKPSRCSKGLSCLSLLVLWKWLADLRACRQEASRFAG